MKYSESEEMYLETIYVLTQKSSYVRSVDVATELGYSKASICNAMKRLREKDYVSIDSSGIISLTEVGKRLALDIYERHHLLTAMFVHLGADTSVAEENACRIEHVISADLVEIIRNHLHGKIQATT